MANLLLANPKKRKAKRKTTRKAVAKKTTVRRRKNPAARKGLMTDVIDAGIGAGGAIAVDVVLDKFGSYIPTDLMSEQLQPAIQGLVSLGLGMAAGKFMKNKALGRKIANGGMTVAFYKIGAPIAMDAVGSMAGFESGSLNGFETGSLGYISPAQVYAA